MQKDQNTSILFIAGLSGAGKSTVSRMLEDLGWLTLHHIPVASMPGLLSTHHDIDPAIQIAFVLSTRHQAFIDDFHTYWSQLHTEGYEPKLLFIDCESTILEQRYIETQRRHPQHADLETALEREQTILAPIKRLHTHYIDTSRLKPRELQRWVAKNFEQSTDVSQVVELLSFGFKHGLPPEADLCIDVRFLKNPYYDLALRPYSGQDRAVQEYVSADEAYAPFVENLKNWLTSILPQLLKKNKPYTTIAIGCTGGQHRSVTCVEALAGWLPEMLAEQLPNTSIRVTTKHRNMKSR